MEKQLQDNYVQISTNRPIWDHFFTVAPLIIVGTKEGDGYDMAPKHMATPLGPSNYFGFLCTPNHSTYHNVKETKEFSISFPIPDQVLLASLGASPRNPDLEKSVQIIGSLPTVNTTTIDALFIKDSYLYMECQLFKIIDGFDDHSFITGKIKTAFVHKDYLRVSEMDEQQQINEFPLLAYLPPGRFASIDQTYNFPFPKGFKK
ncbi:flavin reductase [Arenibacter palladensis]|uniref:flavin reductase n=1 Tax=Arenibacter palladensis TaxID=237373 RepID=UPI002FCE8D45